MGGDGAGVIPNVSLATLYDLHLHLMLRRMIFPCSFTYEDWDGVGVGWGLIFPVLLARKPMSMFLSLDRQPDRPTWACKRGTTGRESGASVRDYS